MSISSLAALGFIEHFHAFKRSFGILGDDHLGNALPVFHHEVLIGEVDEQHHDLAAIVSVYGARGVEHGDTMLQRQTAARTNLCLVAVRQGNVKARRH